MVAARPRRPSRKASRIGFPPPSAAAATFVARPSGRPAPIQADPGERLVANAIAHCQAPGG
jgi:hypothetical protein